MTKLRWGIMGPGKISSVALKDFRIAGIEVTAVGSRSLERAESYAKEHSIEKAYGSYEELAQDPDVDVIYIASTNNAHLDNALLALNSGKHILLEKPFTLDAAQARKIVEVARSKKLFAMEAMWTRFLPNHVRLFEILNAGTIGEVLYLTAEHNQHLPKDYAPRLHDPALGGGSLVDLGVYPISFANRIFGRPDKILASAALLPGDIDESISAIFEYSGGRRSMVQSSVRADGSIQASIIGSNGRIEMERAFYEMSPFTVFDADNQVIERFETKIEGRGMQFQALEVEKCIAGGQIESEIMSLDESVEIMEVMDEIRSITGVVFPGV